MVISLALRTSLKWGSGALLKLHYFPALVLILKESTFSRTLRLDGVKALFATGAKSRRRHSNNAFDLAKPRSSPAQPPISLKKKLKKLKTPPPPLIFTAHAPHFLDLNLGIARNNDLCDRLWCNCKVTEVSFLLNLA
jgi:hypothetical protein